MRVSMMMDPGNADGTLGGAELTMREFAKAAPEDVEWVKSDPDAFIVGNCTQIPADIVEHFGDKPVYRYFNDVDPHSDDDLRAWFLANATTIFTSPLHVEHFPHEVSDPILIPPPLDLDKFRPSRQVKRNSKRSGNVAVGAFQNPGKGGSRIAEWAAENGPVDVYGTGAFIPQGPGIDFKGPLDYERVPSVLWSYSTFVHIPTDVEPFGRSVVEAWAAGMDLVVNGLVGSAYWIEEKPEALETAAADFWGLVCA